METSFWRQHAKPLLWGALGVATLLALRDGLILFASPWPKLHGIVDTCTLSWEEIVCYFPFANRVSLANLFPARPSSDPSFSHFTNFPFLTIWVEAFLYQVVCLRSAKFFLLVMHVLFPVASFALLYRIYQHYLGHRKWTLFFSFVGILTYNHFRLRDYLADVIGSPSLINAVSGASLSPPEITRLPSPSFTFFFFVFCFYLTLKIRKPDLSKILLMSLLWGINLYVYLFNFILGVTFWLLYLIYVQMLEDRRFQFWNILKTLIGPLLIIGACVMPVFINNVLHPSAINAEIMQRMSLVTRANAGSFQWGFFLLHFVAPIAGAFVLGKILSFDRYELFYRFTPILIVAFVELLMLNLHLIFGKFFQPHLFSLRIGVFFFHFLYLVPIVYYINRPPKLFSHGSLSRRFVETFYQTIRVIVVEKSSYYLIPLTLLVVLHSVASSVKNWQLHKSEVAPVMSEVDRAYQGLSETATKGQVVVSDLLPVNLLVPAFSSQASLWSNAFNNYESSEGIVERFALFARIYGWNETRFMDFMLPSSDWLGFYENPSFRLTPSIYENGMGYWLSYHQKTMTPEELEQYQLKLQTLFKTLNVPETLLKYQVAVIQAKGSIDPVIRYKKMEKRPDYTLYWVL